MTDEEPRELPTGEPPAVQNQQQQNQLQPQQQQFSATPDASKLTRKSTADFFKDYRPVGGGYDELVDDAGQIRSSWIRLSQSLGQVGIHGMNHRWKQIRRMIRQNGIAYTAYGDPASRDRHLQLDPLPQLIPSAQWNTIESGLRQRATLLNLLLADLYGPRKLLRDGVLPHDVLFDHPHYQVPYHGLPTAGDRHLHFYSAELVRLASGDWWVLADRTDSPGGAGFALENRLAISRAFPNEFRNNHVEPIANYFLAMREHLASLPPTLRENPNIVILSAGAGSAGYFEDSYLARYLGFSLVQANDLVVRKGELKLKTLAGLEPIDVILRRQEGFHLDPLELGGGSPGVAGIFQAIRDQNVAVANTAGSGLVESPIMMAFMPRICQALLQTTLEIPGVATWWAGEPASLQLMIDRIDDINLLPAFRQRSGLGAGQHAVDLDTVQKMSREKRIGLIRENPKAWVGQERVQRSSTAIWDEGELRSGYTSMRTFTTASGDAWYTMPGGMARVSDSSDQPIHLPFQDGGTKDVWVLSETPVEPISLLKTHAEITKTSRSTGFLSSRVADNLSWLGRYFERADAAARLLRVVVLRLTGESDPASLRELPILIRAMALEGGIDAGYAIKELSRQLPSLDRWLAVSALDHGDLGSLRAHVDQVVAIASRVRERLSNDAWQIIQEINEDFQSSDPTQCDLADLLEITNLLIVNLASFSGLVSETMTRSHAFRFLNLGRRIEHALQLARFIKHCFGSGVATSELMEAALEATDSTLTYCSRYYANFQLPAVVDLLMLDELNPRSLAFQLSELNTNLKSLPGNSGPTPNSIEQRLAMDALHRLRMADASILCVSNSSGQREDLLQLLETIEQQLPQISVAISNRYLVHSGDVTQLIADKFGNR